MEVDRAACATPEAMCIYNSLRFTNYKTLKVLEGRSLIEKETLWLPGQTTYKLSRKGRDKLRREIMRLESAIRVGKLRLAE